MSYTVKKSDNTPLVEINDFSKQFVAGLALLGYGHVNYGETIAENFVRAVENFASPLPPFAALEGQLWYDTRDAARGVLWSCYNPDISDDVVMPLDGNNQRVINNTELAKKWTKVFVVDLASGKTGAVHLMEGNTPRVASSSAVPGTIVVRNSEGKIDSSNLPAAGHAPSASVLSPGRKINNILFDGSKDISFNTDNVTEGSTNKYFTEARVTAPARAAISGSGAIQYNPSTGVISFNPPPEGAKVTSFNNRSGVVNLTSSDVTGALGFTPYNSSNPSGFITSGGRAYPRRADGGDLNFHWSGQTGQPTWLWGGNDGNNMYVYNPANFTVSRADTVDGYHASDLLNRANHTGSLPASAIFNSSYNSGSSGYVIFNNGFTIQWGTQFISGNGYATVTYPIAFSSYSVCVVSAASSVGDNAQDNWPATRLSTRTYAQVKQAADEATTFHWVAMGY